MNRVSIDLNADVGEGSGFDAELVPLVSSVNIACGAHAGGLGTMRLTVALALRHGAAVGAHPGFADPEHFGRRELPVLPEEAAALVISQATLLQEVASGLGARVTHIKLHGALYNLASRNSAIAAAVVDAIARRGRESGSPWTLVALAGSQMVSIGRAQGLTVVGEAFADRTYGREGMLTPRSTPGAVITDEDAAVRQALRIATERTVVATDGMQIPVDADTICLHGDSPHAISFARRIRAELAAAGIEVRRSNP
jgi:UPF0271 protein